LLKQLYAAADAYANAGVMTVSPGRGDLFYYSDNLAMTQGIEGVLVVSGTPVYASIRVPYGWYDGDAYIRDWTYGVNVSATGHVTYVFAHDDAAEYAAAVHIAAADAG
jgi:uncharacterized membrane protein